MRKPIVQSLSLPGSIWQVRKLVRKLSSQCWRTKDQDLTKIEFLIFRSQDLSQTYFLRKSEPFDQRMPRSILKRAPWHTCQNSLGIDHDCPVLWQLVRKRPQEQPKQLLTALGDFIERRFRAGHEFREMRRGHLSSSRVDPPLLDLGAVYDPT